MALAFCAVGARATTTYTERTANSSCALGNARGFTKELSTGSDTPGSVSMSCSLAQSGLAYFINPAGTPNSTDWSNGSTWTVRFNVTVAGINSASVSLVRISSGCVEQELQGSQLLDTTIPGVTTLTFSAVTWAGPIACADRIGVRLDFTAGPSCPDSFTLEVGNATNDSTDSPVVEGTGCGGGGPPAATAWAGPPNEPDSRFYVRPLVPLRVTTTTTSYLLNPPLFAPPVEGGARMVCQPLNPTNELIGMATARCIGGTAP